MKNSTTILHFILLYASIFGGACSHSYKASQSNSNILFGSTGRLTRNSSIAVTASPNRTTLSVLFDSLVLHLKPEEKLKSASYTLDLDLFKAGDQQNVLKTDIRYFIDMDSCTSLSCQILVDTSRYAFSFPFDVPASLADSIFTFEHRPLYPERGKLTFDFNIIITRKKNSLECKSEVLFGIDAWDITTKQ